MTCIVGAGAMATVELPAQQVFSELMARGIDDVVVAVVASPQSTVIGGATQTGLPQMVGTRIARLLR